MKQGSASRSGLAGRKVEPTPHAMNVKAVSQIGQSLGDHVTDSSRRLDPVENAHAGRGFRAPKNSSHILHQSGSQGRYED